MANFQDMIEFLRINRRSEEANKNIILSDNVLLTPLEGGENYYVNRNIFENNFTIYKRLFSVLNANNVYIIYLWETSSDKKYLFQKNTLEYINLLDGATEFPNPSELVEYSIETDNYSIYFYDVSENTIVIKHEDLPETILFTDIIPYHPVKEPLSYFNNGETLIYEYDDETSTTYSALRSVLQHVSTFGAPKAIHNSYRFVDILKDNENGNIHLIPKLYYYSLKSRYFLKYEFWKPTQLEVEKIKKIRPFYEIPNENVALSLEFHSKGAFIMFLNQTIFSQSNFDFSKTYKGDRRQQFKQEFIDLIITPLEKSLFSPNLNYNDIFTTLYYLHESVTVNLSDRFLWFILEWAISKDDLTNFSIKEEDIFIKLIKLLLLKEGQEVKLMNWFLETKIDNDKKITKFEFIYNRIDGSNFMEFAKLVSQVWKKSRFIYPDIEKNPEFATTDGLLFLPYSSKKHLGFYFSSVDMSFENHDKKGRLLKTLYETDKTQKVTKALPRGGTYKDDEAIIDTVWYHPFYPIYLKDIENQETEVKLDAIVPAFMLKANQDKQFWSNVITTAEYAADILTTVSGVGNIAKFRYLANFATKASRLRFVSEAGEAVANVKKVVAATAAAVEITSGTVNTLLKLSGARDAAWGKSLSEYLFWLELLSLSGELSVAIHNGLRKSAKEILEHEDDIRKSAKNADEVKQINEIIDELERITGRYVAEGTGSTKYITKAKYLDHTATLGEVSKVEKEIIEESVEYGIFVDHKGRVISDKFTDGIPNGLNVPTMVDLSTKKYIRIFIHNHPTNTPLSASDIMTFIKGNMQELRAICNNGDVYALIKKGDLPSEGTNWKDAIDRVKTRIYNENENLILKAKEGDKNAGRLYDQIIADTWIEELGNLVEYVKYE